MRPRARASCVQMATSTHVLEELTRRAVFLATGLCRQTFLEVLPSQHCHCLPGTAAALACEVLPNLTSRPHHGQPSRLEWPRSHVFPGFSPQLSDWKYLLFATASPVPHLIHVMALPTPSFAEQLRIQLVSCKQNPVFLKD